MKVRTRFAPSPTGALHLGNIRAAVFNWLFARHHGGAFVLRLEDTDVERNVEGAEGALMTDMRWLGLAWDEGPDIGGPLGPYRQSERGALYQGAARRLIDMGAAYPCFCDEPSGEALAVERSPLEAGFRRYVGHCRNLRSDEREARLSAGDPFVVRLATPEAGDIVAEDVIRGPISVPSADMDDFVLLRRDGRPTYNFAVVVDDIEMDITHVIRGSGHLSNTPKQALLFDAFGHERPVFAHLAQVLDPEGGKLSKRAGATSVAEYRAQGHLPEALVNYLSLLGWSHPDEQEVLSIDELVSAISLERLGASDTAYDPEKLRWVGSQHMAELPLEAVEQGVAPFIDAAPPPFCEWRGAERSVLVQTLRSRLGSFGEIREHLHFFAFDHDEWVEHRAAVISTPTAPSVLEMLTNQLASVEWQVEALKTALRDVGRDAGVKGPGLYHPVRWALTGRIDGPDLAAILFVIGRDECLGRANAALREVTPS